MGAERKIVQNAVFLGKRHDNKILKVQILLSRNFVVMAQAPKHRRFVNPLAIYRGRALRARNPEKVWKKSPGASGRGPPRVWKKSQESETLGGPRGLRPRQTTFRVFRGLSSPEGQSRRPQKHYIHRKWFCEYFSCQVTVITTQTLLERNYFACASVSHGTKASITIT